MKIWIAVLTLFCVVAIAIVFTMRREAVTTMTAVAEASQPVFSDGKRVPVVVELFTSEGCSSCPPADAVLAQLEKTQPVAGAEIIVLSEHVDYWNYIGWADPFSSAAFSARQEAYAQALGRGGNYTPQMVVDGQTEFVGSNAVKAREAITRALRLPKAEVSVTLTAKDDARVVSLHVNVKNLPPVSDNDVAEVLLAITESNLASQVSRGENAGRRLPHTAVVRELRSLGGIGSVAKSFERDTTLILPHEWKREELRVVAFVQERVHRRVLGAASMSLTTR